MPHATHSRATEKSPTNTDGTHMDLLSRMNHAADQALEACGWFDAGPSDSEELAEAKRLKREALELYRTSPTPTPSRPDQEIPTDATFRLHMGELTGVELRIA